MGWKWSTLALASLMFLAGCGATTNTQSQNVVTATGPVNTAIGSAQSTVGTQPGQFAPDFSLKTLDGTKTVTLHDLLAKRQPIFLNAWASWCHPCQLETPEIEKLSKQFAGKIQFVGINMTSQEHPITDATDFVKKYNMTYMVLQDPQASFLNSYNLVGFPTSFMITPDGKIFKVQLGMFLSGQLESWMTDATKGP